EKDADGNNTTDDEEYELSGGDLGEVCHFAHVLSFSYCLHRHRFEAVVISEGQLYISLFRPRDHSWDGGLGNLRETVGGLSGEVSQPVRDAKEEDGEHHDRNPFAVTGELELAQQEVGKQRGQKRHGQMKPAHQ